MPELQSMYNGPYVKSYTTPEPEGPLYKAKATRIAAPASEPAASNRDPAAFEACAAVLDEVDAPCAVGVDAVVAVAGYIELPVTLPITLPIPLAAGDVAAGDPVLVVELVPARAREQISLTIFWVSGEC